ncbi:MAG: hypothetical protein COB93_09465 [Sneathiella sp.]|nr:MAG: hypothetical protein COB93_09465 [Sneathiella sp.]
MKMQVQSNDGEFVPLSKSPIWEILQSYYKEMGVDAWQPNAVPNYVTTNPFIANSYAQVIDGFFQDYGRTKSGGSGSETHYIIELGAGSGRFAYRFLKHFFSKEQIALRKKMDIVYLMTDISDANIDFWRNHSELKPFIDQGVLDFAYFDVLAKDRIELVVSGKRLKPESMEAPIAVIANYVIDSIPHDFFTIRNGKLYERLVNCEVKTAEPEIQKIVKNTRLRYSDQPCSPNYYMDKNWNKILGEYCREATDMNLAMPVGGFLAIDRLCALTAGPVFLLSSDFGDSNIAAISDLPPRHVAQNGTFNLLVNYHALIRYAEINKGQAFVPDQAKFSLETVGILMNAGRKKPRQVASEFKRHINDFGPAEFFMMKKLAEKDFDTHDIGKILALLRLSRWDTKIFLGCAGSLLQQLPDIGPWVRQSVIDALLKVDEMYFRCDRTMDPAIVILRHLLALDAREEAFGVLKKNEKFLMITADGCMALAETYRQFGKNSEAVINVRRALALEPKHPDAHQFLAQISQGLDEVQPA